MTTLKLCLKELQPSPPRVIEIIQQKVAYDNVPYPKYFITIRLRFI
jgi:hypothetical protein